MSIHRFRPGQMVQAFGVMLTYWGNDLDWKSKLYEQFAYCPDAQRASMAGHILEFAQEYRPQELFPVFSCSLLNHGSDKWLTGGA